MTNRLSQTRKRVDPAKVLELIKRIKSSRSGEVPAN